MIDRRSIIFVHGLGSNPDTTWQVATPAEAADATEDAASNSERSVNWVTDFLSEDIPLASRRDVRLLFYNYDSYYKRDSLDTRLATLGSDLLEHANEQIRASEVIR